MRLFHSFLVLSSLSSPACADPLNVVTDIAPIHSLVSSVMEGTGAPDLLLPPGTDPHHHALRPSDATALSRADHVFWIGEALTPWLTKSLESLARSARTIDLSESQGSTELEARAGEHEDEHSDHDHEHHDHDPHGWLDPQNAMVWLDHIEDALSVADPENAPTYKANAAAEKARLSALQDTISKDMGRLETRNYIAAHDSYQYFENRFSLSMTGSVSLSDAAKPGPKKLREIKALATQSNTTCFAVDATTSPDLVATVSEGSGLTPTLIDPLGKQIPAGPDFYATLIEDISKGFQNCLSNPDD